MCIHVCVRMCTCVCVLYVHACVRVYACVCVCRLETTYRNWLSSSTMWSWVENSGMVATAFTSEPSHQLL